MAQQTSRSMIISIRSAPLLLLMVWNGAIRPLLAFQVTTTTHGVHSPRRRIARDDGRRVSTVVDLSSLSSLRCQPAQPGPLFMSAIVPGEENGETGHIFQSFSDEIIPVMLDRTQQQEDGSSSSSSDTDAAADAASVSTELPSWMEGVLSSYFGPRAVLMACAALYATNFPLGHLMAENLPAPAATSARMVFAALALSPFLQHIKPHLRLPAASIGCFTALGYVTQSIALVDTNPARVSFLGAATVLWLPFLEWFVDKRPMGLKEAPQTWLSAVLCIVGVGVLELCGPGGAGAVAGISLASLKGDLLSLLQAVGFGTGCFLTAKIVKEEPDQVLPVTAVLISVTAFLALIWSLVDGWIGQPGWESMALPGMFLDPSMHSVAMAVLWTGLVSTSFIYNVEVIALGRVPPSEASVLLASEPMWAAFFAASFLHETLGLNDYVGGAFIIAACVVSALLKPSHLTRLFDASNATSNDSKQNTIPVDGKQ